LPQDSFALDADAEAGAAWFEEGARAAPAPRGWKRKQSGGGGGGGAGGGAAGPFAAAVRAGVAPPPSRPRPQHGPPGNVIVLTDSD